MPYGHAQICNTVKLGRVAVGSAGQAFGVQPDQAQSPQVCAFQQSGNSGNVAGAVGVVHVLTPSRALAAVADLGGRLGALRQLGRCLLIACMNAGR